MNIELFSVVIGGMGSVASLVTLIFAIKKDNTQTAISLALILTLTATSSIFSYKYYVATNKEYILENKRAELRETATSFINKYPEFTNYWNEGQNEGIANSGIIVLEMYRDLFPENYERIRNNTQQDIEKAKNATMDSQKREFLEGSAENIYLLMKTLSSEIKKNTNIDKSKVNINFSIIKDIIMSIAALATACIAFIGLGKWQKELQGKANFEVARILAKSTYRLRDELGYSRSPFISGQEFPKEYNHSATEHSDEEEGQAWAHIYSKRWEPVGDAVRDFDTSLFEAEALWGKNIKLKAQPLRQACRDLQVSFEAVVSDKYSGGEDFQDKEFAKKMRSNVSATTSADNELSEQIKAAIAGLEAEIRPHLSRS